MTEIVIDSSTLAKFILRESGWREAREFISRRPYTLELALKEVANAIWRRITLLRDIDVEKALVLLGDLLELKKKVLRVEAQDPYLNKALEIAIREGITIYDALFIAQAMSKQATLVSADNEQCRVAERLGVKAILI